MKEMNIEKFILIVDSRILLCYLFIDKLKFQNKTSLVCRHDNVAKKNNHKSIASHFLLGNMNQENENELHDSST